MKNQNRAKRIDDCEQDSRLAGAAFLESATSGGSFRPAISELDFQRFVDADDSDLALDDLFD